MMHCNVWHNICRSHHVNYHNNSMRANIRINELTRVVIVGAGLGGLQLAMHLRKAGFQVVIVDKNNYNQFPPL